MSHKLLPNFCKVSLPFLSAMVFAFLGGCTVAPEVKSIPMVDPRGAEIALRYHRDLGRMTPAQLDRERMILTGVQQTPYTQLCMAMLLNQLHPTQDRAKSLALLDSVLKSNTPEAVALHPLARLLADHYIERNKLESQLDKQGLQLKDSQSKSVALQEKLDGLADIERTMTPRPRAVRHEGGRR